MGRIIQNKTRGEYSYRGEKIVKRNGSSLEADVKLILEKKKFELLDKLIS